MKSLRINDLPNINNYYYALELVGQTNCYHAKLTLNPVANGRTFSKDVYLYKSNWRELLLEAADELKEELYFYKIVDRISEGRVLLNITEEGLMKQIERST